VRVADWPTLATDVRESAAERSREYATQHEARTAAATAAVILHACCATTAMQPVMLFHEVYRVIPQFWLMAAFHTCTVNTSMFLLRRM